MAAFIVFEGGDGSGKTTQSRILLRRLRREGHSARLTHEPGGTPLGQSIRRWLKRDQSSAPLTELLLFSAARTQLVREVLRPCLRNGISIVCDRFGPSTVAYQGYGRGLDLALIDRLNQLVSGDLTPDLIVLLDLAAEVGLARKPSTGDAFDSAPLEFHRKVREGYLCQARQHADRWLVLDATRPRDQLAQEIWARVQALL